MAKALRLWVMGLWLGLGACAQTPGAMGPTAAMDAGPSQSGGATRQVQQNGSVVDIPFPRGYVRRLGRSRIERANAECGRTYLACIDRFERLNPGQPGSFSGVTPTLRAYCERQMDECYQRHGVTPPEIRVN